MHVVQAPCVGLQLADPVGVVFLLPRGLMAVPAVVDEFRQFISEGKGRGRSGAAGILPLRFARQGDAPAGLLRERAAELDCIVRAHPDRGIVVKALWPRLRTRHLFSLSRLCHPWFRAHHGLPLGLRHLVDAHVEGLADRHLMSRILIGQVFFQTPDLLDRFRRGVVVTHLELAGRNERQLHRDTLTKLQTEIFAHGVAAGGCRLAER